MPNFDVLCSEGFFLFSAPLRIPRQGISSSISFALTIINLEIVTREFLDPADLLGAQTLCVHKLLEVIIIGKLDDFMSKVL